MRAASGGGSNPSSPVRGVSSSMGGMNLTPRERKQASIGFVLVLLGVISALVMTEMFNMIDPNHTGSLAPSWSFSSWLAEFLGVKVPTEPVAANVVNPPSEQAASVMSSGANNNNGKTQTVTVTVSLSN